MTRTRYGGSEAWYAERMAILAVRDSNEERISLGLLALGLDYGLGDPRDNMIVQPLLYDAAGRIGSDAEKLFQEAAALVPAEGANGLKSFLLRPKEKRGIEMMGYVAEVSPQGFLYRRTW